MAEHIDITELQNQMVVLAAIQRKQSEILKTEAEEIAAIRERLYLQEKALQQERSTREQRMKEWDERIDKLVSGFGEFLRRNSL
jgi:DNA-binding transcriptional regulator YiaG